MPATKSRKTHCKNGHEFTPENTAVLSDGERCCRTCRRGRGRKYTLKHPERVREAKRKYKLENAEAVRQRGREYRRKNSDLLREKQRKRYQQNPQRVQEINEKWRLKNPERVREASRNRYKRNPERYQEQSRKWAQQNPELVREMGRKYRLANGESIRAKERKWRLSKPELAREISRRWKLANPERVREKSKEWKHKSKLPCPACGRRMYHSSTLCKDCAQLFIFLRAEEGSPSKREMLPSVPELQDQNLQRSFACLKKHRNEVRRLQQQYKQTGTLPVTAIRAMLREMASGNHTQ